MTDWRKLAARMRAELNRADLTERQGTVAEALVKATLARGRARVIIPRLDALAAALGYTRSNVHGALFGVVTSGVRGPGLVGFGIFQVKPRADGGAEYAALPDSRQWTVGWRYEQEGMRSFLRELDAITNQVQGELLEPEPDLAAALADVSVDNAVAFPNREPVPDSGTRSVPESGTPFNLKPLKPQSSKPFTFEALKGALLAIEGRNEPAAVAGMRQVLGETVMQNDGGKWRVRWRAQPDKVHRVFTAMVEDQKTRTIARPGGHVEWLWKQFA